MRQIRYVPYAVVNLIFDKPLYTRAYDTWCPGTHFTDVVVADWVEQKTPGYKPKNNILTFYTPLAESDRALLLTVDGCRQRAGDVLTDFRNALPEFRDAEPLEIHFYRRGHPIFLSAPLVTTKIIPAASQPLDRIAFANTDSLGPESLASTAVESALRCAEWVEKRMASAAASAIG